MARRPVFIPQAKGFPFVKEVELSFEWHAGLAKTQAQKSIASLHQTAAKHGISPVLEISSKSASPLGVSLSAFNLTLQVQGKRLSVECAYQGSKVFVDGGPYTDLYSVTSREAKTDERLHTSGNFIGYDFFGNNFSAKPVTAFYDWLYLTALSQNKNLANTLLEFQGFSDIVFNPNKAFNCQARSAALFVSLCQRGEIGKVLADRNYYLSLVSNKKVSCFSTGVSQDNEVVQKSEKIAEATFLDLKTSNTENCAEAIKTDIHIISQEQTLPDFNIFDNFFLHKLEEVLAVERTKKEVSQIFAIPEKVADVWLKKAESLGKVKKYRNPVRYIATSHVPKQLSVSLEIRDNNDSEF